MTASLDLTAIRARFPALDKEQVYFDNAGGSQVLDTVIDTVSSYLASTNVQLGASYPIGVRSTAAYSAAYAAGAGYINASPDSIVFGASTTQLFRNMSQALWEHLTPGSEMILSLLDHEANIASWVRLAELRGVQVKFWRPSREGTNPVLTPEDLGSLISDKTKLVACTHTSNILGTINPIAAIAEVVHSVPGALLVVDAVAYAPHREVDVQALGVDVYAFSWYKVYGPHVAMLYASPRAREVMTSLGHYFKQGRSVEELLGLAAGSYELLAAVPKVAEYIDSLGGKDAWTRIAAHEEKLQAIVLSFLTQEKPEHGRKITILGEPRPDAALRVPVISFQVEGRKSKALVLAVQELSKDVYGFRWGSFYSNRLVQEVLGLEDVDDGVIRVSLVHYNTEEEVRAYVKLLDETLRSGQ